jgi:thiamine biosynthesis lipoprotein
VDPALGEALVLAGYDRDFELLERSDLQVDPVESAPARMRVRVKRVAGWRTIELDRERGTVRLGRGVRLDLGATAKALAADRGARAAHAATGVGTLVNLGGDIALAGEPPAGGWQVFVTDDHRSDLDAPGQMVSIHDGGLASSSVTCRRWRHEGRVNHHIIDPRTGAPLWRPHWRTVSVAGAGCVQANVASTAALIRGAAAAKWLEEARLAARLVAPDGTVRTVGGWPAPETAHAPPRMPPGV